ncbi:MAG: ArnT family glycosyltransferase [Candidatus Hodarchaeales archaeon]
MISEKIRHNQKSIIIGAFLVFFGLLTLLKRIAELSEINIGWDEAVYLTQATEIVLYGKFLEFQPYRAPLWSFALSIPMFFLGPTFAVAHLFSWILGMATVGSYLLLFQKLLPSRESNFAAIIFCTLPLFVLYVGTTLMSELLFLLFGNFFWIIVLPKMKKDVFDLNTVESILAGFFLGLATLTRYTSFLLLVPVIIYYFQYQEDKKSIINRKTIVSILSFVITIIPLFLLSYLNTGSPIGFFTHYETAAEPMPRNFADFFEYFVVMAAILAFMAGAMFLLFLISCVIGLYRKSETIIGFVLWISMTLLSMLLLEENIFPNVFKISALDLGSVGGASVRLSILCLVPTVMIASHGITFLLDLEPTSYLNIKFSKAFHTRFVGVLLVLIIITNISISSVILIKHRHSTWYREQNEYSTILEDIWNQKTPILTNWVPVIYPYGRKLVLFIPPNELECKNLIASQNITLIVQHLSNWTIQSWWNPINYGFEVYYKTYKYQIQNYCIWKKAENLTQIGLVS